MSNFHKIKTKACFELYSEKHNLMPTYKCIRCNSEVYIRNYRRLAGRDVAIRVFILFLALISTNILDLIALDWLGINNILPIYNFIEKIIISLIVIPSSFIILIMTNGLLRWLYQAVLMRRICHHAGKCSGTGV